MDNDSTPLVPRKLKNNPRQLIVDVDDEGGLCLVGERRYYPPPKLVVQTPGGYIKDAHGVRMLVKPDSLPLPVKLRWYVSAAKAAGAATIVEEWSEKWGGMYRDDPIMAPWPRDPETDALMPLEDETTPPPDTALMAEEAIAPGLPDVLRVATPQQLVVVLAVTPPDWGHIVEGAMDRPLTVNERALLRTSCGSKAEAARLLGLRDEGQVYVQLNRLRKRVSAQPLP